MCLYNTYTRDITSLPDRNKSLLHMYFLWSLGYANFKGPPLPPPLPHGGRASDLWLVTWLFATSKWTKMLLHKSGLLCKHHYYVIYSVCIYIHIVPKHWFIWKSTTQKIMTLESFPYQNGSNLGHPPNKPISYCYSHYPHSIPAISPHKMVGLPSFLSFQITRFKTTCSLFKRRYLRPKKGHSSAELQTGSGSGAFGSALAFGFGSGTWLGNRILPWW